MNILLTTIDACTYDILLFKEALGNSGKVFASNSIMTSSMLKADGYVLTPRYKDSSYVDFLITFCKKNEIKAIISSTEIDLVVLAKNKERFQEHGITVVISDEQTIRTCNDKWRCYQFLSSIGLKQPKTYIGLNLLKQDLASGAIFFPLICKPRWGEGSYGIFQIDAIDELDIIYNKVFNLLFDGLSEYEYENIQEKEYCVLIQEKLTGQEYGLDVLNDLKGNYITTIPKTKTVMREGETVVSRVDSNTPFIFTGKTIGQNLKHIGVIGVDCFLSESGDVSVIEINPRFAAHYPFAHLAGANFPKQIIEWLYGNPTLEKYISYKTGIKGYKDISQIFRY